MFFLETFLAAAFGSRCNLEAALLHLNLYAVSMSETLQDAWLNWPKNKFGAKGEALAWALRKAWFASGNGKYGMLGFVQEHTTIDGHAPRPSTLTDLYKKIDADPEWYPGKLAGAAPGRPSAMTNTNRS